MKNRRMTLVIFLLVAVFCIGSGFAVVSDILDVSGTANVSQGNAESAFDTHIYFTSAVANRAADGDSASIPSGNNDKATFTVNSLKGQNDTTTFTFTIVNTGDLNATVTPRLSSNDNEEYFEVTSNWAGAAQDLAAGGEVTYVVTVKLKKTPTDLQTCNINIELLAEAGQAPTP